jgi:hypothetical protein
MPVHQGPMNIPVPPPAGLIQPATYGTSSWIQESARNVQSPIDPMSRTVRGPTSSVNAANAPTSMRQFSSPFAVSPSEVVGTQIPGLAEPGLRPVATPSVVAASKSRRSGKGEPQFQCPIEGCGTTFTREFNLNRASLVQTRITLAKCICSSTDHLNSHYGIKPFSCRWEGCSWAFGRAYDRIRHEQRCEFRRDDDSAPTS